MECIKSCNNFMMRGCLMEKLGRNCGYVEEIFEKFFFFFSLRSLYYWRGKRMCVVDSLIIVKYNKKRKRSEIWNSFDCWRRKKWRKKKSGKKKGKSLAISVYYYYWRILICICIWNSFERSQNFQNLEKNLLHLLSVLLAAFGV